VSAVTVAWNVALCLVATGVLAIYHNGHGVYLRNRNKSIVTFPFIVVILINSVDVSPTLSFNLLFAVQICSIISLVGFLCYDMTAGVPSKENAVDEALGSEISSRLQFPSEAKGFTQSSLGTKVYSTLNANDNLLTSFQMVFAVVQKGKIKWSKKLVMVNVYNKCLNIFPVAGMVMLIKYKTLTLILEFCSCREEGSS
jgi:hypothetical protein